MSDLFVIKQTKTKIKHTIHSLTATGGLVGLTEDPDCSAHSQAMSTHTDLRISFGPLVSIWIFFCLFGTPTRVKPTQLNPWLCSQPPVTLHGPNPLMAVYSCRKGLRPAKHLSEACNR
ncbi:hypothetical protein XENOCAPTIV_012782 [Xenoophorus captivus]|uniref:Uncharacterized protein n=1 Tax=Xenoophorus captivus TaxID=1517983 RepID=A0ABV0RHI9_9TELE